MVVNVPSFRRASNINPLLQGYKAMAPPKNTVFILDS